MKTIYRLTIVALAAALVLTSCAKEEGGAAGNPVAGADGPRVITLSYGASTKATLDGLQPRFEAGDVIKVAAADGSVPAEDCTVTVEGGVATITTHILDVALKAAFPSTAAVMSGEQMTGVTATVPATQTGKPENAMSGFAAMANIAAGATAAAFEIQSQTALLKITPPSGTTTLTVKSLKPVEGGVSRTGTAVSINTDGATADAKCVITVSGTVPATCYVALAPGVKLCDLSFDAAYATAGKGSAKGIPESTTGATNAVAASTSYTIDGNGWHDYVTVGGNKWATTNIGASSPSDCGEYYAWGEVRGHTYSYSYGWSNFPVTNPDPTRYTSGSWDNTGYFSTDYNNTPYNTGGSGSWGKYTGSDGKTTLELSDDAAYKNWGGAWRMPTGGDGGEFQTLQAAAPGVWTNVDGVNGCKFTEPSSGNSVFFPADGYGKDYSLDGVGSRGYYWSSSLDTDSRAACVLYFYSSSVDPLDGLIRYCGESVRPVQEL